MSLPTPIVSEQDLRKRVQALAQRISADFAGRTVDIVWPIGGTAVFCADLVRQLTIPVRLHPVAFSAYPTPNESGEVRITMDVDAPLFQCDVILLEGVIVSGRTPGFVLEALRLRKPASICICALGVKARALGAGLPIAYFGFEFGAEIVVGYGMGDGAERALPFLTARSNARQWSQ